MKRSAEEEFDVSELRVAKSAKVFGVLTAISPMKESQKSKTKYFDGKLSDGKKTARFVCFDAKMHEKLSNVHEKKDSLGLSNCQVKEGKYCDGLEVVVKKSTEIHQSPKKFQVPESMQFWSREHGND